MLEFINCPTRSHGEHMQALELLKSSRLAIINLDGDTVNAGFSGRYRAVEHAFSASGF